MREKASYSNEAKQGALIDYLRDYKPKQRSARQEFHIMNLDVEPGRKRSELSGGKIRPVDIIYYMFHDSWHLKGDEDFNRALDVVKNAAQVLLEGQEMSDYSVTQLNLICKRAHDYYKVYPDRIPYDLMVDQAPKRISLSAWFGIALIVTILALSITALLVGVAVPAAAAAVVAAPLALVVGVFAATCVLIAAVVTGLIARTRASGAPLIKSGEGFPMAEFAEEVEDVQQLGTRLGGVSTKKMSAREAEIHEPPFDMVKAYDRDALRLRLINMVLSEKDETGQTHIQDFKENKTEGKYYILLDKAIGLQERQVLEDIMNEKLDPVKLNELCHLASDEMAKSPGPEA